MTLNEAMELDVIPANATNICEVGSWVEERLD